MTKLYLIATIYPKSENLEFLKKEFMTLMSATKLEPGCELYDLVQESNQDCLVMMEKWESEVAWNAHMQTSHVKHINNFNPNLFEKATELRFYKAVA